jgi:zinc D-Ala-D-Ala carboxypeptidase
MKFFKLIDSACPCCNEVIPEEHPIWRYADGIREKVGKPITITSGYRCKAYNSSLKNAAPTSKHTLKCALDLSTSNLGSVDKFKIVEYAIMAGLRIGIYQDHIHIDYSPEELNALWYGKY